MTTIMTTHIVTIGTIWKSGKPNWKGVTRPKAAAFPTALKSKGGHYGADDNAQKHRNVGDEPLAELRDSEDHQQHEQRQGKTIERVAIGIVDHPLDCTVYDVRRLERPLRPTDADFHQGNANN
jgi:hypothetical protein